jgi:hypothetical protein
MSVSDVGCNSAAYYSILSIPCGAIRCAIDALPIAPYGLDRLVKSGGHSSIVPTRKVQTTHQLKPIKANPPCRAVGPSLRGHKNLPPYQAGRSF